MAKGKMMMKLNRGQLLTNSTKPSKKGLTPKKSEGSSGGCYKALKEE